ncbi:MAG TPA: hypothetical protein VM577_09390 [Anaerovoracaceae bacterium]|nr:hypothetical protein [Anaerovoracaceae bacterium]
MIIIAIAILAFNLYISFMNARVAGQVWVDAKVFGGWIRALVWCAATQSAIGFSSGFLILYGYLAYKIGFLNPDQLHVVFSLWYLIVAIPLIGTGLLITVQSWITAWRERSFKNMGVAAYNTFAEVSDLYHAFSDIPKAFKEVMSFTSDWGDDDDLKSMVFWKVIVPVVVLAIASGCILTYTIIHKYAGTLRAPAISQA